MGMATPSVSEQQYNETDKKETSKPEEPKFYKVNHEFVDNGKAISWRQLKVVFSEVCCFDRNDLAQLHGVVGSMLLGRGSLPRSYDLVKIYELLPEEKLEQYSFRMVELPQQDPKKIKQHTLAFSLARQDHVLASATYQFEFSSHSKTLINSRWDLSNYAAIGLRVADYGPFDNQQYTVRMRSGTVEFLEDLHRAVGDFSGPHDADYFAGFLQYCQHLEAHHPKRYIDVEITSHEDAGVKFEVTFSDSEPGPLARVFGNTIATFKHVLKPLDLSRM